MSLDQRCLVTSIVKWPELTHTPPSSGPDLTVMETSATTRRLDVAAVTIQICITVCFNSYSKSDLHLTKVRRSTRSLSSFMSVAGDSVHEAYWDQVPRTVTLHLYLRARKSCSQYRLCSICRTWQTLASVLVSFCVFVSFVWCGNNHSHLVILEQ